MPTANTPLGRAVSAVSRAQEASDRLAAFVATHADAGAYLRSIAESLATELALAEASLLAAQPRLADHLVIDGEDRSILHKVQPSALWLDLGDGVRA